ncbi:HAMP domain-containing histidine kinase [Halosquirtibacter xylanolyticus]|uniref:sensor histidine kinase n=1 Tax=Halosquirtibacter xylanolyticus TaxID=3374599 RepID=UPI00374A8DA2|nr:HAMP domain-containing histidine kinase [Prolixibacteraceae bacterium]
MSIKKQTKRIVWATTVFLFITLFITHLTTFNPTFKRLQKDQLDMYKFKVHSIIQNQSKGLTNLHRQIIKLDNNFFSEKTSSNILKDINIHGLYLFRESGHILKKVYKSKQLYQSDISNIYDILTKNLSIYGRSEITGIIQIERHVYIVNAYRINQDSFDFSIIIRRLSHRILHDPQKNTPFKVKFIYKRQNKSRKSSGFIATNKVLNFFSPPKYCHSKLTILSEFSEKPIYWKIQYEPLIIDKARTHTIIELLILIILLTFFSHIIIKTFENQINKPLSNLVKQIDEMTDMDTLDPISHHDGPHELVVLSNKLNQLFNEYNAQQLHFYQNNDNLSRALIQSKLNEKQIVSFFSNMSHDIRTPLNAIIGFSELISENICNENEKKEYARIVLDNGIKLIDYIENIIELSTLINNTLIPNKRNVPITQFIQNLQVVVLSQISKHQKDGLELLFKHSNYQVASNIYTDEKLLSRCITNLTSNAIKFTEKGHVHIDIKTEYNQFIFRVTDTGIGIKKELLEHIGKEFLQEEDTYTKSVEGTGIGLSISYRIARILGGKIVINSIKGKGTEAIVSIPLST